MRKSDLAIARELLVLGLQGKGKPVHELLAWQDAIDRLGLEATIHKTLVPGRVSPFNCTGDDANEAEAFIDDVLSQYIFAKTREEFLNAILECMQKHKKQKASR